ncbi:hypothetical protein TNCV_1676601 [Trichonephila clavipes]|nr:hypothetical protein TNCV_1676601 [Trichonephila clavipes]
MILGEELGVAIALPRASHVGSLDLRSGDLSHEKFYKGLPYSLLDDLLLGDIVFFAKYVTKDHNVDNLVTQVPTSPMVV